MSVTPCLLLLLCLLPCNKAATNALLITLLILLYVSDRRCRVGDRSNSGCQKVTIRVSLTVRRSDDLLALHPVQANKTCHFRTLSRQTQTLEIPYSSLVQPTFPLITPIPTFCRSDLKSFY